MLVVVSEPERAELVERLARLEVALAQRDTVIERLRLPVRGCPPPGSPRHPH
jgi:hypothetical protein